MSAAIDPRRLQAILAPHLALYRRKLPTYQATMLTALGQVWAGPHRRLLDVGGGTGVIAQAVSELFPAGEVTAIDLVDRFCPSLTVAAMAYDGAHVPFADRHFDGAMLNNVLHHVPEAARVGLLAEIRRVVAGPLYIKDHERAGPLDHARLVVLDALGNVPFGGMIAARYLSAAEWQDTARAAGWRIAARAPSARYRRGPMALAFPNRLEVTMRLEPA